MQPIKTLLDLDRQPAEPILPAGLQALYDGDLRFPPAPEQRPYVFGNFVSTLDGIVSYSLPGYSSGAAISGSDDGDRFIMSLLRASADAIVVGARTVQEVGRADLWIPSFICPAAAELYSDYRRTMLRKPEQPLLVIVSGSGRLDLDRAIFRTPEMRTVIITSTAGSDELLKAGAPELPSVQVTTLESANGRIEPRAILQLLFSRFSVRAVLHEGGPSLFGQFVAQAVVDELFLTLAPQIAGRVPQTNRPGMVEGVEFLPGTAPWWHLVSVKQRTDHLYLRYRAWHNVHSPVI
jgi:riboflavin biosynthesis pyrimidine reductase